MSRTLKAICAHQGEFLKGAPKREAIARVVGCRYPDDVTQMSSLLSACTPEAVLASWRPLNPHGPPLLTPL